MEEWPMQSTDLAGTLLGPMSDSYRRSRSRSHKVSLLQFPDLKLLGELNHDHGCPSDPSPPLLSRKHHGA